MRNAIMVTFLTLIAQGVIGQDDLSGFFMHDTYQRSHFNPAMYDDKAISIGLINGYFNAHTTGPDINSVALEDNDGVNVIQLNQLDRAAIDSYAFGNLGTIEISARIAEDWYVSGGHSVGFAIGSRITEDLLNVAIDGNAPYIGQELALDPSGSFTFQQEFYLGLARKIGKLDIGARASFVRGLANVSTGGTQLRLTTDEEYYQLNFDNDFTINTSGGAEYDGIDNIDYTRPTSGSNNGIAIDLGLRYRVNEDLVLSASVLNLGGITWDASPQNFTSRGEFSYDGIDITPYIEDDIDIELSDSLSNLLQITETAESYTTSMPTRIIIGADYQISDRWNLGGVASYRHMLDQSSVAIGVNAQAKIGKALQVGAMYSLRPGNPINLGLNAVCNLGPVQILLAADNLLYTSATSTKHVHLRGGLGLRFG